MSALITRTKPRKKLARPCFGIVLNRSIEITHAVTATKCDRNSSFQRLVVLERISGTMAIVMGMRRAEESVTAIKAVTSVAPLEIAVTNTTHAGSAQMKIVIVRHIAKVMPLSLAKPANPINAHIKINVGKQNASRMPRRNQWRPFSDSGTTACSIGFG